MSGPPKTPTHLVLVKGNPSKRAINKNEPKPPSGVPPIPKHLDKMGKYWFTDHPAYKVLCKQPNGEMTPSRFMLMLVASICMRGNAFIEKLMIGQKVVALNPLLPQNMVVERLDSGQLRYTYTDKNGKRDMRPNGEKTMAIGSPYLARRRRLSMSLAFMLANILCAYVQLMPAISRQYGQVRLIQL